MVEVATDLKPADECQSNLDRFFVAVATGLVPPLYGGVFAGLMALLTARTHAT